MIINPLSMGRLRDPEPEPPAAFDPVAFKADLLSELRKDLNGISKSLKNDITKLLKPEPQPPNPDPPTPEPPTPDPKIDPALNARLQAQDREIKALREESTANKKAREEAENKQRDTARQSTIRDVIAGVEGLRDEARKDAYKMVASEITYDDEGNLIANTEKGAVSADEYIKGYFADPARAYMFPPRGVGGAGAKPTNSKFPGAYIPRATDDVSKLTPEQREVFRQQTLSVMKDTMSGAQ